MKFRFATLLLLLVLLVPATGCLRLAPIVRELKDDPAQVTLQLTTIYGTLRFTRNGSPTNAITVAPDGTVTPVRGH